MNRGKQVGINPLILRKASDLFQLFGFRCQVSGVRMNLKRSDGQEKVVECVVSA
jgi:hypothetical protein